MPEKSQNSSVYDFVGIKGDEDPDFFYDEETGKWLMAVCRLLPDTGHYTYLFYESQDPFEGYTFIGRGIDGIETGGSFVKINGKQYFVCGNNHTVKSEYRIYDRDGMKKAVFNFSDGGYRGWEV